MKKVLIGCGIFVLLAAILFVGAIAFVGIKINSWTKGIEAAGQEIQTLNTDYPFVEPSEAQSLDPDRFQDYLEIRQTLFDQFMNVKFIREIALAAETGQQPNIGPGDVFTVIGAVPGMMRDFAETMREAEMSPDEYAYIMRNTVEAVDDAADSGDPELGALWDEVSASMEKLIVEMQANNQGQQFDLSTYRQLRDGGAIVPAADVQLVRRHSAQLSENPAMLVIELFLIDAMQNAAAGGNTNVRWQTNTTNGQTDSSFQYEQSAPKEVIFGPMSERSKTAEDRAAEVERQTRRAEGLPAGEDSANGTGENGAFSSYLQWDQRTASRTTPTPAAAGEDKEEFVVRFSDQDE
ncbi:MAG: hypothetical protein RLY93_00360 [Sumerlaeia bacterium]